jgi:hypothetical protein
VNKVIDLLIADILPSREAILANQGIPAGSQLDERIEKLVENATEMFSELASPKALVAPISTDDFASVYNGEGLNEPETPVGEIFSKATHLALFAITVGQAVGNKISKLFDVADFALGSMLDSVASAAAERGAESLQYFYLRKLIIAEGAPHETSVLRYSPGYCGWHISGQKALFAYLHPQQIGITLRASFLMEPLKSVSGAFIAGPEGIHHYIDSYPFCSECGDHSCRYRQPMMLQSSAFRLEE